MTYMHFTKRISNFFCKIAAVEEVKRNAYVVLKYLLIAHVSFLKGKSHVSTLTDAVCRTRTCVEVCRAQRTLNVYFPDKEFLVKEEVVRSSVET